jgi:hypothetical protein
MLGGDPLPQVLLMDFFVRVPTPEGQGQTHTNNWLIETWNCI